MAEEPGVERQDKQPICLPGCIEILPRSLEPLTHQGRNYASVKSGLKCEDTKTFVEINSDHDALCFLDA